MMMIVIMIIMTTEFDHIFKLLEILDEKYSSTHSFLISLLSVRSCGLSLIYYLMLELTQDFADFSGLCVSQSYLLLDEVF